MSLKPILAPDANATPTEFTAENLDRLRALFPSAFREGKINFDALRQLLGGAIDDRPERYGLNWNGKRAARQLALTPSAATLRPDPGQSVNWDTTQNLMIEGDNLEVLKLLQGPFAGKVKLIYIDPPYNTGKDFIYPDNFRDSIKNYLELTGQTGEAGAKLTTNPESSGRFHTDWLNMMYPRLFLARNLLRDDGAIFISIDDHEVANLRLLMDEIFGPENFLANFVWRRRQMADSRTENNASTDHEYVVAFTKKDTTLAGRPVDTSKYANPDNDPRGPWFSCDMTGVASAEQRPNLHYTLTNPLTGDAFPPSKTRGWAYSPATMAKLIAEKRVIWPPQPGGRPRLKAFLAEAGSSATGFSTWLGDADPTSGGTKAIQELFGDKAFPFAKPTSLVQTVTAQAAPSPAVVLDFFAGSGTAGHAVMAQNAADSGDRRYILVQIPEPTGRTDYPTIADICRERLRRAGEKVRAENPLFHGDLGFRSFKLDSSNIRPWPPETEDLAAGPEQAIQQSIEHLKLDRSEQDILYEALLRLNLDPCLPIATRPIAGKTAYAVGAGALFACLDATIAPAEVEPLALGIAAWRVELQPAGEPIAVFRDSAFADDVAKTNLVAILRQHGFLDANLRSI